MKVTLYGATWCPACKVANEWLSENEIDFEYVNISTEENRERFRKETGAASVPVLSVDDKIEIGFNPDKFKELLKI
ncbi:glutaredoxin family protein [Oceanihabitans sediminis]|uniref:glutaredoxin family protein n=1 Tax=Oceanihabitans sediminis TaxID=1812012 RepID=UPI00299E933D|nr:glutaredoxin family protein [Oceanihabitans sediminis]MDX1279379.1 glutaredoxin family protein [Oceanihabitans sediminis]